MSTANYPEDPRWREILNELSRIREQEDYRAESVAFIRQQLQSLDDRVRGGAALAAEGCLFEPYILDMLMDLVEHDPNLAIRKAAIQSLQGVIREGVEQQLEDAIGPGADFEYAEDWMEVESDRLRDDYLRVRNLLLKLVEDEMEPMEVREAALASISDLGFLPVVREWIDYFIQHPRKSARLVALHAMGKYPHYWEAQLGQFIAPETDKALLMEAISASYASQSARLAKRIETILGHPDPDVLSYALMALANINQTKNLGEILQKFSLHPDPRVQEAAKDAIEHFSRKNFDQYLRKELGYDD